MESGDEELSARQTRISVNDNVLCLSLSRRLINTLLSFCTLTCTVSLEIICTVPQAAPGHEFSTMQNSV